jgi:transposase
LIYGLEALRIKARRPRMFLRHTTRTKNGKTHIYWRLVQSVRVGEKVRQRTVATLGELDEQGRARARKLAEHLGVGRPEPGLFDEPDDRRPEAVEVLHREVRLERSRSFGGPWLGHELWHALRLDELLRGLLPSGRETVPWAAIVEILAVARLCEPSSELHIEESWYRTTAFEDILGVRPEQVNTDRLYRALDLLLPHKVAIERHLKSRLGELFELPYDLMLYDLTSTYFEGQALGNPDAKHGHSSDRREDCKQVCIALVVSRDGMPFGYEVFPGNQAGARTVKKIVRSMEDRYGKADRIWVMDRGMVSEANLAWLREEDRQYLVGAPRSVLKGHERELLTDRAWKEIRPGVSVKLCAGPEKGETLVLCRSEDRRAKEKAVCDHFSRRIEERLTKLQARLKKVGKPVDRDKVAVQVGRILGQNTRAAGRYKVRIETDARRGSGLAVRFTTKPKWAEWTAATEGVYALRTNLDMSGWAGEELWLTYIGLTDAESAFRTHKHDLALRPVWHQKADRVKAHILVCFLAYVMWRMLEQWQKWAGLGQEPRKIIEEIGRIQSADVVLPTTDGKELRLRCVVQPESSQKILLDRLGLTLPKRLRPPSGVEM